MISGHFGVRCCVGGLLVCWEKEKVGLGPIRRAFLCVVAYSMGEGVSEGPDEE